MKHFFITIFALGVLIQTEWKKVKVPDEITIHKMTYHQNNIWGVSYGNGAILKSEDGGNSWNKVASLNAKFFEKTQFIDENNGFVCGDYGYVYKTNDGGKNWVEISPKINNRITKHFSEGSEKPDGEFINFYDMYFDDAKNGYIIGFSYNPAEGRQNSTFQLYYTTRDGGENWEESDRSEIKSLQKEFFSKVNRTNVNLGGVYYSTPSLLYQVRSQRGRKIVLSSNNGGVNWKQLVLNDQELGSWIFRSILFTNEKEGFIFGGLTSGENPKAVIFKTKDGGESWKLYENNWPAVHHAILKDNNLIVSTKEGEIRILE